MNERHLICPHCGFLVPIVGAGSKTVVKVDKPRIKKPPKEAKNASMADILQDHFNAYWKVASLFGGAKNFQPSATATLYMEAIEDGATDEMIFLHATRLDARTNEKKYLPQLAKWLSGRSYMPDNLPPKGTDDASNPSSRLLSRSRAE